MKRVRKRKIKRSVTLNTIFGHLIHRTIDIKLSKGPTFRLRPTGEPGGSDGGDGHYIGFDNTYIKLQ